MLPTLLMMPISIPATKTTNSATAILTLPHFERTNLTSCVYLFLAQPGIDIQYNGFSQQSHTQHSISRPILSILGNKRWVVVGWQQCDNLNYMQGQQEEAKDFQKIILVGDASTGKTHIAYTFVRDKPPTNIMPTVAVEFSAKSLILDNGRKVRVQTWDTAGQEAYRSITMNHYRKANGAFIVFDVSRRSSFQHVAYWLQNLREKGEAGMQIGLIGHKIDSSRREVSTQQGEQLAVKERLLYAETTINDPVSIALAFKRLANSILQAQSESVGRGGGQLRLNQGGNAESGCSC